MNQYLKSLAKNTFKNTINFVKKLFFKTYYELRNEKT